MRIFREAAKAKLRFNTSKGLLTTEQLWEVKLTPLARIVRALKQELTKDNDDDLSFLDDTATPVDKVAELRFNVAKAVYLDMKSDRDAEKNEAAKKVHNEKIMALIAEKQEGALKDKSLEELTAMIQD